MQSDFHARDRPAVLVIDNSLPGGGSVASHTMGDNARQEQRQEYRFYECKHETRIIKLAADAWGDYGHSRVIAFR